MKKHFILLIITILVFGAGLLSCLEAEAGEKFFEYHRRETDMVSHGFSTNNTIELRVTIYGGKYISTLDASYFRLTRINQIIELKDEYIIRNDDTRVAIRFDSPLPDSDGYKLTVKSNAIQPDDFTRTLIITPVSGSGS
ncbi:MAG: hypothetical protein LBC80_10775 [Treponema sp.]|jgi:hypothetical protein|nr:hypothetical protein [Treponema sp.]